MSNSRERELEEALSEGLDLCVRARKLDALCDKALQQEMGRIYDTKCATPAMWLQDQYDTDLATWEQKSRKLLLGIYA